MFRIESSNTLRSSNNKSTLFANLGSTALDRVTITGLG